MKAKCSCLEPAIREEPGLAFIPSNFYFLENSYTQHYICNTLRYPTIITCTVHGNLDKVASDHSL